MNMTLIIASLSLIYILITIIFAIIRRTPRSRIRFFTVLGSAIISLALTLITKVAISNEAINATLHSALNGIAPQVISVMDELPGVTSIIEKLAFSMISPLMFLLFFILFNIVTWVFYFLVTLILSRKLKRCKKTVLGSTIYGTLHALVVLGVLFVPISFYTQIAPVVVDSAVSANAVKKEDVSFMTYVEEVDKSLTVYRACGGGLVSNMMTDLTLDGGKKLHIKDEIGASSAVLMDIVEISKNPNFAQYGPEQAILLRKLSTDLDRSALIPAVTGEFLYSATDKWIMGEKFIGISKPNVKGSLSPMVDKTLTVLHNDARDSKLLAEDIDTAVEILALLAENRVLSQLGNTNTLLDTLASGTVTHDVILTLSNNDRMRPLISDFAVLGITAIANAIKIPNDTEAMYNDFIEQVAAAATSLSESPMETKTETLSLELETLLNEVGVAVDKNLVRCVAIALIEDISATEGDTKQAVRDFFTTYAVATGESIAVVPLSSSVTGDTNRIIDLGATASIDTFAEALGIIVVEVENIPADAYNRSNRIDDAIRNALSDLLKNKTQEEQAAMITVFKNALSTAKNLKTSSANIASLHSHKTMNTVIITLEDIMSTRTDASQGLSDPETEAAIFGQILSKGVELMSMMENSEGEMDINTLSTSVGGLLNLLLELPYMGAESTGNLFISMVQCDMVNGLLGNDLFKSRELAMEVVQIGDYEQAFRAVSVGMQMMNSVSENKLTNQENITDIIEVVTPDTVDMFKNRFTPDDLKTYGFSDEKAESASEIITLLMDNIAVHDESVRDEDVDSVMHILNIAIIASEKKDTSGSIVGESGMLGDTDELVSSLLSSQLGQDTLIGDMTENGAVKSKYHDAFGISAKLTDGDRSSLQQSVDSYLSENPDKDLEAEAFLALFGITKGAQAE